MWIFIIICIILTIVLVTEKKKPKAPYNPYINYSQPMQPTQTVPIQNIEPYVQNEEKMPYYRKNLLTKNEWAFYKQLKPIADKMNLSILAKVRVADLVDIQKGLTKSEWQTAFNRVNKKHIDFILCNPDNLYPLLLVELDDSTHQQEKQKERDEFVEALYKKTGYKLLRVSGAGNIEEKICAELNMQLPAAEWSQTM